MLVCYAVSAESQMGTTSFYSTVALASFLSSTGVDLPLEFVAGGM